MLYALIVLFVLCPAISVAVNTLLRIRRRKLFGRTDELPIDGISPIRGSWPEGDVSSHGAHHSHGGAHGHSTIHGHSTNHGIGGGHVGGGGHHG